jgi:hypothetical protein
MTSSRHFRVLCLHGYHGSGALLRRQMAPLAAALPPCIELVELLRTGPHVDGVFGFSHGAALTDLLAGLCEDAASPAAAMSSLPPQP